MNHFTCPRCVRHDDTWPHVCRVYEVRCDHCAQPMAGYARQIMDAAVAHSRICTGLLRPHAPIETQEDDRGLVQG